MVKEKEYHGVTMLDRALKEPGRFEAFLREWTKGVWCMMDNSCSE